MRLSGFVAVFAFAAVAAAAERMTAEDFFHREDLPVQFDSQELQRLVADLSRLKGRAKTEILAAIAAKDGKRLYLIVRCPLCYACMHADTLTETTCGHVMHRKCLERSVKYNGDFCPECRTSPVLGLDALAKISQVIQGVGPLKKMLILFDKNEWIPPKLNVENFLPPSFENHMANRLVAHINIVESIILEFAAAFYPQNTDVLVARSNVVASLSRSWQYDIDEAFSHPNDKCYEFLNYDIHDPVSSGQDGTCHEWLKYNVPLFRVMNQLDIPPPTNLLCNLMPLPGTTWKEAYIARARFMNWILSRMYELSMDIVPDGVIIREFSIATWPKVLDRPSGWWQSLRSGVLNHILQRAGTSRPADFRQLAGEWLVSLARVLCGSLRDELRRTEPGWLSTNSSRWHRRVNYLFEMLMTLVYSTADKFSGTVEGYRNHFKLLQVALQLLSRPEMDVTNDYTHIAEDFAIIENNMEHDLSYYQF